jgi:hypothetical protein
MGLLLEAYNEHIIKQYHEEKAQREARRDPKAFPSIYPSEIGKCSRCIAYRMLRYPQPEPTAERLRTMDQGNWCHEKIQQWLTELGYVVAYEHSFCDPDLNISGRIDCILRLPWKQELVIAELKSAKKESYERMVRAGRPYESYIWQLQLYLYDMGYPEGLILIENKNDQSIWEWWTEYDPAIGGQIVDKSRLINESVKKCLHHIELKESPDAALPPREFEPTSLDCSFCDYFEFCYGGEL